MGKASCDEYEAWDLSPFHVPARSTLYALEPMGVGTPYVESLTSYITRLAEAHGVFPGILVNKVIAPQGQVMSPKRGRQTLFMTDGRKSHLLNATGIRARRMDHILEALTRRVDFRFLTLLPWSEVLYVRGLLKPTKAWCGSCYEEWRTAGQIIYEPLIWGFQEITTCACHQQPLSQQCPYQDCRQALPALAWRSRPGHCSRCGRWLGMGCKHSSSSTVWEAEERAWQEWVIATVGGLLAEAPFVGAPPARSAVTEVLTSAVQQIFGGSVAAFATALGVPRTMLAHWFSDKKLPQMDMLLRICFVLGFSLCEFLLNDAKTLLPRALEAPREKQFTPRSKWNHILLDKGSMQQTLKAVLTANENPPPSVKEIARRLGYDPHVLYKCDKTTCQAISARYLAHIRQQREERVQQLREEVQLLARQLHAEGVSLSKHHLAQVLKKRGYLRSPELREAFDEIRRELETSDGEKSL